MILSKLPKRVKIAIDIAKEAHKGQKDKAGKEYINHPLWVASKVYPEESAMVVAVLHDTVEDTKVTFDSLTELLTNGEMEALKLLTHDKGVPYMDYIHKISENRLATKVKIADLRHNMDLKRLPKVSEKDIKRVHKYQEAYNTLVTS